MLGDVWLIWHKLVVKQLNFNVNIVEKFAYWSRNTILQLFILYFLTPTSYFHILKCFKYLLSY